MRSPLTAFRPAGLFALAILLSVGPAAVASADVGPPEIEEAGDVARRAALDLVRTRDARLFSEALDADGILVRRLGADAWSALTDRQKERLRTAVRERFHRTLSMPVSVGAQPNADIAWSTAQAAGNGVDVFMGLKFEARVLKTRWVMRHVGGGWRIADVILTDPAVSIARSAEQSIGKRPPQRGTRSEEIWANVASRAAAIGVIIVVAVILLVRLPRAKRPLVYWTAIAPILLIAIDGGLAVQRTVSEPFVVGPEPGSERWRNFEQLALAAEREGKLDAARELWSKALAAGGPGGPIEYQIGLAALRRGDTVRAQAEFARSLSEPDFAPGASRELGAIQVAAGHFAEAEPYLTRYLELSGPDPDTLALLAVIQTNTNRNAEALETIRRARSLVSGEAWRGDELEAQVRARAGDAAGTVAALRPLDARGLVDRAALRADPTYLPIATDPAWIAFLNERKKTP